jgi:hypothetical protein
MHDAIVEQDLQRNMLIHQAASFPTCYPNSSGG